MRRLATRLVLGCALLTLSACFESKELLFSKANAAYPFANHTNYILYTRETGRRETDWKQSYAGTITLGTNRIYTEAHHNGGKESTSSVLLFSIGDGYYIIADISDPGASGRVYYDLLKLDGTTVYRYGLDCASAVKADLIAAAISPPDTDGFCNVKTLDGLIATFRRMIDQGSAPGEKYELVS